MEGFTLQNRKIDMQIVGYYCNEFWLSKTKLNEFNIRKNED